MLASSISAAGLERGWEDGLGNDEAKGREDGKSNSECWMFTSAQELLFLSSPSAGNFQQRGLRATEQTG